MNRERVIWYEYLDVYLSMNANHNQHIVKVAWSLGFILRAKIALDIKESTRDGGNGVFCGSSCIGCISSMPIVTSSLFPFFLFSQFPEMDEWLCIVSDHPTMADDSERNLVKSEMWSSAAASSYSLCLAPVGFGGNHVKRAHKKKCFKNIRQKQNLLSSDFAFHRLQIWSTQDNIT